ncbi:hypothetical protein ILYODFUR_032822 [Ilyodon furcidens]|uniref:Integrase zinc-binding domain-containing protein n=1 Tax=Ilyodon furcidens TaxID=33524 RepID=A0ABV0T3M6_9TELE
MRQTAIQEAHGVGQLCPAQMLKNLEHWWHPYLKDMVKDYVKTCVVCTQFNVKLTVRPEVGVRAGKAEDPRMQTCRKQRSVVTKDLINKTYFSGKTDMGRLARQAWHEQQT